MNVDVPPSTRHPDSSEEGLSTSVLESKRSLGFMISPVLTHSPPGSVELSAPELKEASQINNTPAPGDVYRPLQRLAPLFYRRSPSYRRKDEGDKPTVLVRRKTMPSLLAKKKNISKKESPVLPVEVKLQRHATDLPGSTDPKTLANGDGFLAVFGVVGIPMVIVFILAAIAMLYLAYVQVFPREIANFVMQTSDLDYGEFWLLHKPPLPLVVVAATSLLLFACAYTILVVVMLFYRHEALYRGKQSDPKDSAVLDASHPEPSTDDKQFDSVQPDPNLQFATISRQLQVAGTLNPHQRETNYSFRLRLVQWLMNIHPVSIDTKSRSNDQTKQDAPIPSSPKKGRMYEFTNINGVYYPYYEACFDMPKLLFQTVSLGNYLSKGFPLPLINFYATLLMTNWVISFYRFQRNTRDNTLIATRLFNIFDLFFAAFAPIVVLCYSYYHFNMDRAEFAIRQQTLSPGSYELIARLFADPVEIGVFHDGFANMQLTQTWIVAVRCSLNILVLYRWKRSIMYLITYHHAQKCQLLHQTEVKTQPKRRHTRHRIFGTLLFFSGILGILVYTTMAVTTSLHACAHITQCKVVSYRWNWGADIQSCPCRVFIDRDLAPRTYDSWLNPSNVTGELAEVAAAGYLRTIQIINRAVPSLPKELRHNSDLEQLILIHSRTLEIPEWVRDFTQMHYLHIETNLPLRKLPLDLFSRMASLRFLCIGGASALTELPSLQGLFQLKTLSISHLDRLTQLPAFDDLHQLVTLVIMDATHVTRLPSLQTLNNLKSFSLVRRNAMCCNGFLTGTCDLTAFQCLPREDEAPVACESARASSHDRALIDRIGKLVCNYDSSSALVTLEPTLESTDIECGGVKFRECHLNDRRGICYNGRMQVIHCDITGEYERMRRLQIALGVGLACDPAVEHWLGCGGQA